jgi:hypothetical protein
MFPCLLSEESDCGGLLASMESDCGELMVLAEIPIVGSMNCSCSKAAAAEDDG